MAEPLPEAAPAPPVEDALFAPAEDALLAPTTAVEVWAPAATDWEVVRRVAAVPAGCTGAEEAVPLAAAYGAAEDGTTGAGTGAEPEMGAADDAAAAGAEL